MKKILFLMIMALLFACSDNKKEQVFIEDVLESIGNGYYSVKNPELIESGIPVYWRHSALFFGTYDEKDNNPFGNYELENSLIEENNEEYRNDKTQYILSMFQTNNLFESYEFVSRKDIGTIDIVDRNPVKFDNPDSDSAKNILEGIEVLKKEYRYKEYDDHIVFFEHENVPIIEYVYKLDNEKLATIHLVKHPEDGYKITRFNIEGY